MGKAKNNFPSSGEKSSFFPVLKKLKKVEITSKKLKRSAMIKKKVKHHIADWKVQNKDCPNNSFVVTNKSSKRIERKSHREQVCSDVIDPLALDEYFKSVDDQAELSDYDNIFESSNCEMVTVAANSVNVSCGSIICDSSFNNNNAQTKFKAIKDFAPENGSIVKKKKKKNLIEELPTSKEERVKFYGVHNNKTIIEMKHPCSLYFQGQLHIKVVVGSLEILGYTLTSDILSGIQVFSPGSCSLLCLTTSERDGVIDKSALEETLAMLGMSPILSKSISCNLQKGDCLALVEKGNYHFASYLTRQCAINLYPRFHDKSQPFFEEENKLQCQFVINARNVPKGFTKLTEWDQLADTIVRDGRTDPGSTSIMVCGGKSVGKSTLLRFLINKALSHFDEVLCLDFDPGQSEFTVPGCVSVVKISNPLLGPNFTHLLTPERRVYVGDVDISKCPSQYIKCAEHILDYYKYQPKLKNMVCFINTMGYSKGLGVDLTTCLIHMVQPSRLIQIESRSAKRNFPHLLTAEYASKSDSQWCRKLINSHTELRYDHHVLQSAAEKKVQGVEADWGMQPKTARDVMVLSYFSEMLLAPKFSLTDVLPFKVSFSKISLCVSHETLSHAHYLSVMNAELVALCVVNNADNILRPSDPTMPSILAVPPVGPCLGFGIVRGIDMATKTLYLITPLPVEELKSVNCLVLGAVKLPTSVYTQLGSGVGHIPYVTMGPGQATSKSFTRRFFLSLNH